MPQQLTFKAGVTYFTRSMCDSECIFKITVEKRTAQTILTTEGKRYKIRVYEGVEQVSMGRYSMAPIFSADRIFTPCDFKEGDKVIYSNDGITREVYRTKEEGSKTFLKVNPNLSPNPIYWHDSSLFKKA